MISAVFGYSPDDSDCIPVSFDAADLVECGAGVTALLAEDSKPMDETITESAPAILDLSALQAILNQPGGLEAIKAFVKVHEKSSEPESEAEAEPETTETASEPGSAASDEAAMSALVDSRVTAALATIKADLLIEAEAKMTAMLGTTKVPAKETKQETALFGLERVRASIQAQLSKSTN